MFNIMVVEDDKNTRRLMETVLIQNGYNAIPACDSEEALSLMDKKQVDLIVLDVMMPGMDGFQFTRLLRDGGCDTPILMVTARETHADKREGFLAGTDDYMVKPVDEEEMLLRINALLRRAKIASERCIVVGNTKLSYDAMTVEHNGVSFELPQKEFLLIFKLLSYQNKVFTRRQLMDELWDMDSDTDERTVDVHINRLRERFRNNDDFEIITVRGLGYKAVARQ
jgi:DNA-binding response OmpR family regulator